MLFQSETGRHIEQAANAERRIGDHARHIGGSLAEFELEQVVYGDQGIVDIGEEVPHAGAYRVRQDGLIAFCHGFHDRFVNRVVELIDAAIKGFQRVARVAIGGATGQRKHDPEQGEFG